MKEPKKTIAVRVEGELHECLEAKAEEFDASLSGYVRGVLTEAVMGESRVAQELRELKERQMRLEWLLKKLAVALLVDAGKASVEDAEAFVRQELS
jgi:hypothetical protein